MSEDLELLKKDLIHQLSFEDIDWDYFNETVARAVDADDVWQKMLRYSNSLKEQMEGTAAALMRKYSNDND